eukprot:TRINITY_DN8417_c0_g1_i1.p1 TRINITY_DN8417_c0_g1~~TRINITY_DN8417_c0_g1_i1.p1  ORF type:complete len:681 (+),score=134.76 TRINITY_DN8417_c0_g1_i1:57-2099(+)
MSASPLQEVILSGDRKKVAAFLNSSNINGQDAEGNTLLHYAAEGHVDLLNYLISSDGADLHVLNLDGSAPIHQAAIGNFGECVEILVNIGKVSVQQRDSENATALHHAASSNAVAAVQRLIELNADINAVDKGGFSALHHAAFNDSYESMQYLLSKGAKLNLKDSEEGSTPLILAAFGGFERCVRLLLDNNAPFQEEDNDGATALHKAAYAGHPGCAQILIDTGAEIDRKDKTLSSPLHMAAYQGRLKCAKLLIERGAAVNEANKHGRTPLQLAVLKGHQDCVIFITNCGGKTNVLSISGSSNVKKTSTATAANGTSPNNTKPTEPETDPKKQPAKIILDARNDESDDDDDEDYEEADFSCYDEYGFERKPDDSPEKKIQDSKRLEIDAKRALKWSRMFAEWNKLTKKKKGVIQSRVLKGIPSCVRGMAWKMLVDSTSLQRDNPDTYADLCAKARSSIHATQIDKDIKRTYRNHFMFRSKKSIGQKALSNILKAYSVYDAEVGYCQGMSTLTALLLMFMEEEEAFWVLVRFLKYYGMTDLYKPGFPKLFECFFVLEKLMKLYLPELYAHLETEQIMTSMYATKWFIHAFVDCLPFPTVLRVWDIYLWEGPDALYRVALAILKIVEGEILKKKFEDIVTFLNNLNTYPIKPEVLVRFYKRTQLKSKKLQQISKQYKSQSTS